MGDEGRLPTVRAVADLWDEWSEVVRLFALKLSGRLNVDPEGYCALQRELLLAVRSLKEHGETGERELFAQMEEFVSPWVNLESLNQAEREIAYRLMVHSQRILRRLERRLGIPTRRRAGKLALLAGGGLILGLVAYILYSHADALAAGFRDAQRWAWRTAVLLVPSNANEQLLLVGSLVILVLMTVVWFSGKLR